MAVYSLPHCAISRPHAAWIHLAHDGQLLRRWRGRLGQFVRDAVDNIAIPAGNHEGNRTQTVFVDKGQGRFEPREVKLGHRGAGYVEVRQGVADGEPVVVSANFLIDAESNLKAALKGFSEGAQQ